MSLELPVKAVVNSESIELSIDPRLTLAEFVRDRLGLTGTKLSCEMQVCGACTVLVDGQPVSACSFLAVDIDGRDVTTIEGLGTERSLHPIQQAFIDEFAMQCGFCTPGFVLMTKALLDERPDPTSDEIIEYMEGNICRCTGYRSILRAVLHASEMLGAGEGGDS
ncbi:MAG: (2Fe-2S)-binding protein [Acidimicrobiia bacterium]|nr:(2Fe-2S)-binding protein [Acidimicrobiia bacterium]